MSAGDTTGGPGASGPKEPEGPDAVEQLQRAVLTAIGATRAALDALEAAVADRTRLDNLAAGGRDFVGSVWGTVFGRHGGDAADERADEDPGPSDPTKA